MFGPTTDLICHLCAVVVKAQMIHVQDGAAGSGRLDSDGVGGGGGVIDVKGTYDFNEHTITSIYRFLSTM